MSSSWCLFKKIARYFKTFYGEYVLKGVDNVVPEYSINRAVHLALVLPETLAVVFRHLNVEDRGRAAQVCVNWRDASDQQAVWRDAECRLRPGRHIPTATIRQRKIRKFVIESQDSVCLRSIMDDLTDSLPDAESLRFTKCDQLTDAILRDTFPPTGMKQMTCLVFDACTKLTDASVELVTELITNLVDLDLQHCNLVTDDSLLHIAQRLSELKNLNLTCCPLVTDVGIGHLASHGSDMVRLHLTDCKRVTDKSYQHLSNMTELKYLQMPFHDMISHVSGASLVKMTHLLSLMVTFGMPVFDHGLSILQDLSERLQRNNIEVISNIAEIRALPRTERRNVNLCISALNGIGSEGLQLVANALSSLYVVIDLRQNHAEPILL